MLNATCLKYQTIRNQKNNISKYFWSHLVFQEAFHKKAAGSPYSKLRPLEQL